MIFSQLSADQQLMDLGYLTINQSIVLNQGVLSFTSSDFSELFTLKRRHMSCIYYVYGLPRRSQVEAVREPEVQPGFKSL